MKFTIRLSTLLASALVISATASAGDAVRQDPKAMEVLKGMSALKAGISRATLKSTSYTDARLEGGLMVSNPTEVTVNIERPDSLKISSFDGLNTKELYFHDGELTVFNSANNFYAQANIPREIDAALEFALEEMEIEAPLLDMIYKDVTERLITSNETILYLQDKARIAGTDCHHIAIRGAELDVQLWVQQGDRPMTRKIILTSKWEGGSPRFEANLTWDLAPDFDSGIFEFRAPENATRIEFVNSAVAEGE